MPCTTTQNTIGATIIEISFRKASLEIPRLIAKAGVGYADHDAEQRRHQNLNEQRCIKRLARDRRGGGHGAGRPTLAAGTTI